MIDDLAQQETKLLHSLVTAEAQRRAELWKSLALELRHARTRTTKRRVEESIDVLADRETTPAEPAPPWTDSEAGL